MNSKYESMPISKLVFDPANARKHGDNNLMAIKGSLSRFKQQKPIVVSKDNVVIAGNGTLQAAIDLGWTHIDVSRSELKGSDITAFALADNRTSELAEWDDDILGSQLQALYEEGVDISEFGFDPGDLDLGDTEGNTDPDDVPEVADNIHGVKLGQIYQLGEHRLMCGDSTDKETVEKLMNGEKADMVFTSPPYNGNTQNIVSGKFGDIKNADLYHNNKDDMSSNDYVDFNLNIFDVISNYTRTGAPIFYNINYNKNSPSEYIKVINGALTSGMELSETICWEKTMVISLAGDNLTRIFEFIFLLYNGPRPKMFKAHTHECVKNIWKIVNTNANYDKSHGACFPVELPQKAIDLYSESSAVIYEPFCGLGSTLIACEKTKRKCYGMELDPHYCSVIIERWQNFTGKEAKLIG